MRTHSPVLKASRALLATIFISLLPSQTGVAQPLHPAEEEAINRTVGRLISSGLEPSQAREEFFNLRDSYVAAGRLAAAETLFKKVIAGVDKPAAYLTFYQPPFWASPRRTSIAIITATFHAYPELIGLLIAQGRTEEALEFADMMRAKTLRAVIERNAAGSRRFEAFSTMSAPQMRALAKETQSTFIVYALLPARQQRNARATDKSKFDLFAWVIQPSGRIAFETLPIETTIGAGKAILLAGAGDDIDPISVAANSFSRSLQRGVVDRLEPSAQAQQRREDAADGVSPLRNLHEVLISRLEAYLPTNPDDNVVIVPDGSLYLVPFAALPNSRGEFLIERHTLSIAPSIAIFALSRPKAKQKMVWKGARPILVVGNPKMPTLPAAYGTLPELAGADKEADEVANLFGAKALKGVHALEDEVAARMSGAKLIHFATHGLLLSADFVTTGNWSGSITQDLPPGSIVLADNPKKRIKIAEGDYTKMPVNGFLSSGKILKLKLNADLVTLSACDTARGRTIEHDFAALPSALMAAGARSVVMTLWAIPDAPTAEMMPTFYKGLLAGRSKAAALRHAMLATKQRYSDVESWGAFTLIGSPD
jgi:CHAT domain-containing protein